MEGGLCIIDMKNRMGILVVLLLFMLLLESVYIDNRKVNEINSLNTTLKDKEEKEELLGIYKEELPKIKDLKQKIKGQETKIDEYTVQIEESSSLLNSNKEKLNRLLNS